MARPRRDQAEGDPTLSEPPGPLGHGDLGPPTGGGELRTDLHKVEAKAKSATVWTWVIPALVFLVVMLIFILQNFRDVEVSFLSLHGRFPLALCLMFSGILGALTVAFLELGRAVQIRRTNRRKKLGGL